MVWVGMGADLALTIFNQTSSSDFKKFPLADYLDSRKTMH